MSPVVSLSCVIVSIAHRKGDGIVFLELKLAFKSGYGMVSFNDVESRVAAAAFDVQTG